MEIVISFFNRPVEHINPVKRLLIPFTLLSTGKANFKRNHRVIRSSWNCFYANSFKIRHAGKWTISYYRLNYNERQWRNHRRAGKSKWERMNRAERNKLFDISFLLKILNCSTNVTSIFLAELETVKRWRTTVESTHDRFYLISARIFDSILI